MQLIDKQLREIQQMQQPVPLEELLAQPVFIADQMERQPQPPKSAEKIEEDKADPFVFEVVHDGSGDNSGDVREREQSSNDDLEDLANDSYYIRHSQKCRDPATSCVVLKMSEERMEPPDLKRVPSSEASVNNSEQMEFKDDWF